MRLRWAKEGATAEEGRPITKDSNLKALLETQNTVTYDLQELVHLSEHWQLLACLQDLFVLCRVRLLCERVDIAILHKRQTRVHENRP